MKSILFLSVMNGAAWGGSEELWYQSALWTARNGYPTGVCCFAWKAKSKKIQALEQAGCQLFLLPGKEMTGKMPLLGKLKGKAALRKVPFETYDQIIVSQGGWKDVAHAPFKKLYQRLKNYSLLYHNYNVQEKFSRRRSLAMKEWVNKASKNLGDTEKIFLAMATSYIMAIPNQGKLFNPLTFETPATPAPYPGQQQDNYIFSVFAALDTERKAQEILIEALAGEQWRDKNWELHLYGEGKDKKLLQELIASRQMQGKIFLRGKADNYQEAIRQTHLVLQITHIDAMPITVMDAMAMARPVVVSDVGDMPNWIKQDLNGWVANYVTVDSINHTLRLAWERKENWEAMGKESFAIFHRDFPEQPVEYFLKQTGFLTA